MSKRQEKKLWRRQMLMGGQGVQAGENQGSIGGQMQQMRGESPTTGAASQPTPSRDVKPKREVYRDPSHKGVKAFYFHNYRKLLWIPIIIIILSIAQIGYQVSTTGDFIQKGVSLKGGATITILHDNKDIDLETLRTELATSYPDAEVSVKATPIGNGAYGIMIEAGITPEQIGAFNDLIEEKSGIPTKEYTTEIIGSSLGASFFKETFRAMLLAFLFMGIVVLIFFRVLTPSLMIISCAVADILATIAISNVIGIQYSTAGFAALLMLIGYSVDTDMVLTNYVLKRKEGKIDDRIIHAMKTGLMMTSTGLAAVIVGLIFTNSEVLRQIMTIVLIGMSVDVIFTWIQNVAMLKIYLERRPDMGGGSSVMPQESSYRG